MLTKSSFNFPFVILLRLSFSSCSLVYLSLLSQAKTTQLLDSCLSVYCLSSSQRVNFLNLISKSIFILSLFFIFISGHLPNICSSALVAGRVLSHRRTDCRVFSYNYRCRPLLLISLFSLQNAILDYFLLFHSMFLCPFFTFQMVLTKSVLNEQNFNDG